jgi:hypothetical protein
MYAVGTRKYMKIKLDNETKNEVYETHNKKNFEEGINPLEGNILSVKIPYRYRRVDCQVLGITPVEDLKSGDEILTTVQFCGAWKSGLYWRFNLIQKIDPPGGS